MVEWKNVCLRVTTAEKKKTHPEGDRFCKKTIFVASDWFTDYNRGKVFNLWYRGG